MAMTIERLDNDDQERDIRVVIGKNVLFKLQLKPSPFHNNSEVRKLIGKDLVKRENFEKLKELVKLNKKIKEIISLLKNRKDQIKNIIAGSKGQRDDEFREFIVQMEKKGNLNNWEQFVMASNQMGEIEKFFDLTLISKKYFCFCNSCHSLIEEGGIEVPTDCVICKNKITRNSNVYYNFLTDEIEKYLDGDWLSDYIAKAFIGKEWKVWTNSYVMGNSGIPHEVDLLAINRKGFTLVGECKTGTISRKDVFTFSTKCSDISNTYACFFTAEKLPEPTTREFMDKTGLKYFENIHTKTEENFFLEIFEDIPV